MYKLLYVWFVDRKVHSISEGLVHAEAEERYLERYFGAYRISALTVAAPTYDACWTVLNNLPSTDFKFVLYH